MDESSLDRWNDRLLEWAGSEAKVFRANVVDGATIVLFRDARRDTRNLTIDVLVVGWLSGPLEWADAHLEVRPGFASDNAGQRDSESESDGRYELVDTRSRFVTAGDEIRIVENEDLAARS